MPVDDFSPNTNARMITRTIPIPLIPDLEIPNKKTAKQMAIHCKVDKLKD